MNMQTSKPVIPWICHLKIAINCILYSYSCLISICCRCRDCIRQCIQLAFPAFHHGVLSTSSILICKLRLVGYCSLTNDVCKYLSAFKQTSSSLFIWKLKDRIHQILFWRQTMLMCNHTVFHALINAFYMRDFVFLRTFYLILCLEYLHRQKIFFSSVIE